jgi:hypothetical protein
MVRHHALKQIAELSPPAWFGLQVDDHLDSPPLLTGAYLDASTAGASLCRCLQPVT